MASDESTIIRKVYFFKIEHFAQIKESLPGAIERIEELEFNDNGRYKLDAPTGSRYCAFPDSEAYPIKIRFGKTRRDFLPQIEHIGSLKTLELREEEGLIDISHIMIFEDGFVAAEWNHEGPKISQLGHYLFEKGRLNSQPVFLNLVERDIVDVIDKLSTIRVIEIDLPPDSAELAREADQNLYHAIKAAEALGGEKRIALKLTAHKDSGLLRKLAHNLASIVKNRPHERTRFKGLTVNGYDADSKARFVDILESKLVSGEVFTRADKRSRGIDSDDAYRVIQRAYKENKQKLLHSAATNEWS